MRTLHLGLRVSDLERSITFYTAVGYAVVGTVEATAFGSLTMLQLPDDDFVTIELVHDPEQRRDRPRRRHQPPRHPGGVPRRHPCRARGQGDRARTSRAPRWPRRPACLLDHRPGRLSDRAGPVAGRTCRRHHRRRLRLSDTTAREGTAAQTSGNPQSMSRSVPPRV